VIPFPKLPLTRLLAPAAVPPIVLPLAEFSIRTPSLKFEIGVVPAEFVPM
jgi:hypothetical protein